MTRITFAVIMLATVHVSCTADQRVQSPDAAAKQPPSVTSQLASIGIQGCHSVRAYTINLGERHPQFNRAGIIYGILNPSRSPTDGVELTPLQVAQFVRAAATSEHPGEHARCFYPHHSLIFLDAHGKILGRYTICFICRRFQSSVGRFVREPDYEALSKITADLKLPKP